MDRIPPKEGDAHGNAIAGSIARWTGALPDAIFKDVLAYKEVSPYYENLRAGIQGLHHSQIIGYIEPNPRWGWWVSIRTRPTCPRFRACPPSTTTTEERVVYDVLFRRSPGEDGKIGLIINTSRPGGASITPAIPVKRAIYYCGRTLFGPIRVRVHLIPLRGNSEGIFHLDLHPAA